MVCLKWPVVCLERPYQCPGENIKTFTLKELGSWQGWSVPEELVLLAPSLLLEKARCALFSE